MEDIGWTPEIKLCFSGKVSEKVNQIEVVRVEVLELINNLKDNKPPGLDGLHPRVFKELKYSIADNLTIIIVMCH